MTTATPTQAEPLLRKAEEKFGFVPNVLSEMAKSPAALAVYMGGQEALSQGTLSDKQRMAVELAVSAANKCAYCVSAHSWGGKLVGISPSDIETIRTGGRPQDADVAGVVHAARRLMEKKGWLDDQDLRELEEEGIDRGALYEIIAIIAIKLVTNYVNHIAHTPEDPQYSQ